ncbi:MAG: type II CRISPR RNA-guided endonuclease Cas9 [Enterocloster sp.]
MKNKIRKTEILPQTLSYELIDRQPLSPAVKRQVWQTILIIKELCQAKKQPPKRIFIEMAREKQNTDRTVSRRKQLIDLYQSCKKEERDWINELNEKNDSDLRRDKLYLYYVQMGRCMYSGEPIELSDLWNDQKYDIDHIYPQSKVMDDSLDNRVLVKRTYNADKTDIYPISEDIRKKQTPFWKMLLEKKFIWKRNIIVLPETLVLNLQN